MLAFLGIALAALVGCAIVLYWFVLVVGSGDGWMIPLILGPAFVVGLIWGWLERDREEH